MSFRTFVILILFMWMVFYWLDARADGAYLELGTGFNRNLTGCTHCWDDGGADIFGAYSRFGYDWHVAGNTTVGAHWIHLSQWTVGYPLNDDSESSVDHLGVFVRWDL